MKGAVVGAAVGVTVVGIGAAMVGTAEAIAARVGIMAVSALVVKAATKLRN